MKTIYHIRWDRRHNTGHITLPEAKEREAYYYERNPVNGVIVLTPAIKITDVRVTDNTIVPSHNDT